MKTRTSKSKSLSMEKADKYFSLYIRLKNADENGICRCITCGNHKHYKDIQLGHWRRRGLQPTRYDERNCAPQCVRCNKLRSGEPEIFEEVLKQNLGEKLVEEIRLKSLMRQKRTQTDFEYIALEYKQKLEELLKS
jgi:hypothetical protein